MLYCCILSHSGEDINMEKHDIKYYLIKFVIMVLVNAIFAAAAYAVGGLFGEFNIEGFDEAGRAALRSTVISAVAGLGFFVYMGLTAHKPKYKSTRFAPREAALYGARETAVLAVWLIPMVILGYAGALDSTVPALIYAPHLAIYYAGFGAASAAAIQLAIFFAVMTVCFMTAKIKTDTPAAAETHD